MYPNYNAERIILENRICVVCGNEYGATSIPQKMCPTCGLEKRKQQIKDSKKRYIDAKVDQIILNN